MRVVGGTARSRRLQAPAGRDTRPTTDRVREAIFNVLATLGAVEDAEVADLFAGSGALGIEALSRGAAHASFVESDRRVAGVIRGNLESTDLLGRAQVVVSTVERWSPDGRALDLVLADPPYAFDGWVSLLERLEPALADGGVVVAESDRALTLPARWAKVREKAYGSTVITFARVEQARTAHGPQE